jgi:hypothetical protein
MHLVRLTSHSKKVYFSAYALNLKPKDPKLTDYSTQLASACAAFEFGELYMIPIFNDSRH